MKATIDIEFEMNDRQPENAAEAALIRGIAALRQAIEYGSRVGPTGVKAGSVTAAIVDKKIDDA